MDDRLDWIRFNPFGYITVEDALKLYGDPEKVFGVSTSSDTKGVEVYILYPSKGVNLSYGFWEHFEETVRIVPTLMVGIITYFDPGRWEELVVLGVPSGMSGNYSAWRKGTLLLDMQPEWEGFDFEYPVFD